MAPRAGVAFQNEINALECPTTRKGFTGNQCVTGGPVPPFDAEIEALLGEPPGRPPKENAAPGGNRHGVSGGIGFWNHENHSQRGCETQGVLFDSDVLELLGELPDSPLDRALDLSLFADPFARSIKRESLSLRTLSERIAATRANAKAGLPLIKFARFGDQKTKRGAYRHDANLISVSGVEGDYDAGEIQPQEAARRLQAANLAGLIYSTPSHTDAAPRWRVFCPCDQTHAPDRRAELLARVNGALGGILAPESFTLSQSYFIGRVDGVAFDLRLIDGRPVDLAPDLDAGAIGKDGAKPKPSRDRSAEAYGLALQCVREGLQRDHWERALASDPDLTQWAKDKRQADRAWAKADAVRVRYEDLFEDLPDFPEETLDGFPVSEDGVARAFEVRFRDRLRFDHSAGRWFVWSGTHWRREETKLAFSWARDTCRAMANADAKAFAAKAMTKAASAAAVERFAQSARCFAVTGNHWDRDPWKLGTPGGVVDLKTGLLRPAEPADMIAKQTAAAPIPLEAFDPARDCPRWLAFLDEATGGDAEAIRFLQQWAGYSLTGDTREQALMFVHGPGGSGKSTAINTLGDVLGNYCVNVDAATLSASKFDRHSTELARLKGARMARASETEQGRAWAQQRIKALTGGDVITARFMRMDDFEFRPEFKLLIVGNHAPAIENVDSAMRRRFNVLPFTHPPARADAMLGDALRAEWPAILSWAIAGCLDWQTNGLVRPRVVTDATDLYFDRQDTFTAWIESSCVRDPASAATSADLYASWRMFALSAGEAPGSAVRQFPERMQQRGFSAIKNRMGIRGRGYAGIRIADGFDDEVSQ